MCGWDAYVGTAALGCPQGAARDGLDFILKGRGFKPRHKAIPFHQLKRHPA